LIIYTTAKQKRLSGNKTLFERTVFTISGKKLARPTGNGGRKITRQQKGPEMPGEPKRTRSVFCTFFSLHLYIYQYLFFS
jgi:hypothetical protein